MKQVKKQENETFSEKWFTTTVLLRVLIGLLLALFGIFLFVMFCDGAVWIDWLGRKDKGGVLDFIGITMGGVLLVIQATLSYRRAKAMEDTAKAQADAAKAQAQAVEQTKKSQRQERLKNAIEHLGHKGSSVRLGGAYELFHLAEDTEELGQTVLEILCTHIRRITRGDDYQKEYGQEPSEEIQILLTLLFVQDHKAFRGCHINLQGSCLNGASLPQARLQKADLRNAQLQRAELSETQLQGAKLWEAQLQEADLSEAHLQGAKLWEAQLQEADLSHAQLQGAELSCAQLRGAKLKHAELQRADLWEAQLQEANLEHAQLQGACLSEARLERAVLSHAKMKEAKLNNAHLQGAKLFRAQLQGAYLLEAHLQVANLFSAQLQGADLRKAQLQGADLRKAQLQGAILRKTQLQGAQLSEAQLQGACLQKAQLQGANLFRAQLQGIVSSDDESQLYLSLDFTGRIWRQINEKNDFSTVVFSGDLSEGQVNNMMKEIPDAEWVADLKEILKPHIGKPISHELPSGAETGSYTQKDAEQWIKEYEKAVNRDDVHS